MSVTLKELRISKGLNQAQCAEYLGMSTRNYQNYENDAAKANTLRKEAARSAFCRWPCSDGIYLGISYLKAALRSARSPAVLS